MEVGVVTNASPYAARSPRPVGSPLRLVHSGFSSDAGWDHQYDGTVRGWDFELRSLKHYLEHHRGTTRRVVHAKRVINDMELADGWARLMSRDGFLAEGSLDGLTETDEVSGSLETGPDGTCHDFRGRVVRVEREREIVAIEFSRLSEGAVMTFVDYFRLMMAGAH